MATLILLALFAVVVSISALVGLIRGMNKSIIRLVTLILAAALTFVIAAPVTRAIIDNVRIEGLTLGELILDLISSGDLASFMDSMPMLKEAILVAPTFVLGIVVFPLVFIALRFVTWILFLCIQRPLRRSVFKEDLNKKNKKTKAAPVAIAEEFTAVISDEAAEAVTPVEAPVVKKPSLGIRVAKRFAGMGLGIISGVLIFAMLMTTVFGLFNTLPSANSMNSILDTLVENEFIAPGDAATIKEIYGITDNDLVNFYGTIGFKSAGSAYLNSVSKFVVEGQTMYLAEELATLLSTVQTALEGETLNALLQADDPAAMYALLADKEFVDSLMQDLFSSKILCAAVPELVGTAMESVAAGMNLPANKEVVYNNMMDDIATKVKESEVDFAGIAAYEKAHPEKAHMSVRRTSSKTGLLTEEEYEAEITKLAELTAVISKILNRTISGDNTAFTDAMAQHIVNDVKVQVSEGGEDALANINASSVQTAVTTADPATVGGNTELLEQLQDPAKFETSVPTVETIKETIVETVKAAVSDENKAAETASTLSTVVSDLVGAVSEAIDENGNVDPAKLNFDKVASAVTTLQNSPLKDLGTSLLDVVVSSDLGENEMVGGILESVKQGYENGEDIGGTIGTAGALINMGNAMAGGNENATPEENQEALVNSLTSLINNLNDFTIGLLPNILSNETLSSMGIPEEFCEPTFKVIETLLKELMALKGAEDYQTEVDTILSLYNLATTGLEDFSEENVSDLVGYALKSDAIYNTLMSVSTSNPFGIEIPDKATRKEVVKAIEGFYDESGKTEKERNIFNAVAMLLGVEEYVELD